MFDVSCIVDGGWSDWQKWSPCSAKCDKGIRYRMRSCSRPETEGSGNFCYGEFVQTSVCHVEPCKGKNITHIGTYARVHKNAIQFNTNSLLYINVT